MPSQENRKFIRGWYIYPARPVVIFLTVNLVSFKDIKQDYKKKIFCIEQDSNPRPLHLICLKSKFKFQHSLLLVNMAIEEKSFWRCQPASLLAFFRLSSSSALTKEASVSELPTKQVFISTMICFATTEISSWKITFWEMARIWNSSHISTYWVVLHK